MRFKSLRTTTIALGAIAAVGGALMTGQTSSAAPAKSAQDLVPDYQIINTAIPAGSSGPVEVITPADATEAQIAFDVRATNFGTSASMVTWEGDTCRNTGEALYCTPTDGHFTMTIHIPSTATVATVLVVKVRPGGKTWGDMVAGAIAIRAAA